MHKINWHSIRRVITLTKSLLFIRRAGYFHMLLKETKRRLYSDETHFGLRRDLTQRFEPPEANMVLTVRPLGDGDISILLDVHASDIAGRELYVHMQRLNFLKADVPTCYVAVTSDNSPCYMQWLIGPSENEKIQTHFNGGFPLLAPDEALLEYAFTPNANRGQRIMPCAMAQIAEKAQAFGTRWVITFVDQQNIPALKGSKRAGFVPYLMRKDTWRLFHRRSTFKQLPPGTPYHSILNNQQKKNLEETHPRSAPLIAHREALPCSFKDTVNMKVPFLDLKVQYEFIQDEIRLVMQQVLDSTAFAGGPFVAQLEKEFASFCECHYAIGVSSGTAALWLSLLGLGIGHGDEVITVPNTFIATAEAISFCGAKPVFVDIDEHTYNMNPALLETAITPRTKAVIPVHLFGQMADMDPIMEIAKAHRLFVIEDASQAHGAEYKGRLAGSIGDAGCFSFYPGKNLGAYGEAGAVVTNNADLIAKVRMLRDHGQSEKYHHAIIGWNARMDGLQGAALSVKLKYLPNWNEMRRTNATIYTDLLADVNGINLPKEGNYTKHVYHIYAIRAPNRNALISNLGEKGIHCGVHYPIPIHLQQAYAFMGAGKGTFPVTEQSAEELVSLPMYPELTREQIERVVTGIKCFVTSKASV